MNGLLPTLFGYQAWADAGIMDAIDSLDPIEHQAERHAAIRLLNHSHVVARIFAAHLTGTRHGYASDNTPETPEPAELRAALAASDRWYLDYVGGVTPAELAERVAFGFTDGDKGFMSREEMLGHVVVHGGYHRGEVGRILSPVTAKLPWDTVAVYLHQSQPSRRLQGERAPLPA